MTDYRIGFDLYCDGKPDTLCINAEQLDGWWDALKADADSDTSAYLVQMAAANGSDISDDYAAIRAGM